ncbi:hypothetical protein ACN28G_12790 [Micromonospora sp. WMMA1923]|uniref:hypothetical protein n=1 Tax=Micromonospora sp. WMMA1923 TaxID=3404125 RepID=UPI003B95776C
MILLRYLWLVVPALLAAARADSSRAGRAGALLAVTGSWALAAAAVLAVAVGAAVADPHGHDHLDRRYGTSWRAYRRAVRPWWPRWRPYPGNPPARLWLDAGCGPCARTGRFLLCRRPTGLRLRPAARHRQVLWRAEYVGGDGHIGRGVVAVAHGLDHLQRGWAYLGWLLRPPGPAWLAQLVTDAMIAPPHPARVRGDPCPTPSSDCSTAPSPRCANTG